MSKKTITFFMDFGLSILTMSDENAGALFKAAFAHEMGQEINMDGKSDVFKAVLPLMLDQLDRMKEVKESRRAAGALGGSKTKQTEANTKQNEANASKREANVKQTQAPIPTPTPIPTPISNREARFAPPTTEEVADYADQNHLNVNAERFVDYYESVGWKVAGKAKMKDWKAAVRNWAARDKKETFGRERIDYDAEIRDIYNREVAT